MKEFRSPAFQFYPNDWLSSRNVAVMTPAQRGGYIQLLCYDWTGDGIPDDDKILAALSGLQNEWSEVTSSALRACFEKHPSKLGYLSNPRIQIERQNQIERRKSSSEGGKMAAKNRASGSFPNGKRMAKRTKSPLPNHYVVKSEQSDTLQLHPQLQVESPSSPSEGRERNGAGKKFVPPTLEECEAYGKSLGLPANQCKQFHDRNIAIGWKVGAHAMKDYKAAMRTWFRTWQERGGKPDITKPEEDPKMMEIRRRAKLRYHELEEQGAADQDHLAHREYKEAEAICDRRFNPETNNLFKKLSQ